MQAHQYWNTQISNFCINNLGPHQLHGHNKNVDANQEEDEKKLLLIELMHSRHTLAIKLLLLKMRKKF
ncbi:hypothetical protein [Parachlamydia acanthamoebae]|uniref:Uncharacterized protein n=1 Tax=Parachlamydia acanthamoebae TaxID=83552 RepID=A0A0C1EBP7_9BACT|nr:hypothetical protein [Parachlamydia acanthamoebae]KIA78517.1 hypothetical protein DB43_DW00130 [Parachlamydia acanthamoebae]